VSVAPSVASNYVNPDQISITQGKNNAVNYRANPAINVTVNLVNHSNYGQNLFQLITVDSIGINKVSVNTLGLNGQSILKDTIAKYQLIHYSHVNFNSYFNTSDGQTANEIIHSYILGNKDTLINITNP